MKKPEMRILEEIDGIPVAATCSACEGVTFHTGSAIGKREDHRQALIDLFTLHFEHVHMHEDASQAASRIVRQATEEN